MLKLLASEPEQHSLQVKRFSTTMYSIIGWVYCVLVGVVLASQGITGFLWCSIGFLFGVFVAAQLILPVLLGIPLAIRLVAKHQMRASVFGRILATPIIWCILLIGFGFLWPSAVEFLQNKVALNLGMTFGTIAIILSPLSAECRSDFRTDFDKVYASFYKKSDVTAKLANVDFEFVQNYYSAAFQNAEQEAKEKGGSYYFDPKFIEAIRPFMEKPCLETAVKYLKAYPLELHFFEDSKKFAGPASKLSFALIEAADKCRDSVKDLIQATTEQDRLQQEVFIYFEFVYFFMHLTMRQAFGVLTQRQLEKLKADIGPIIASLTVDSCVGHWPDDLKQKIRGEFYENLNRAEFEYSECSKVDPKITGDEQRKTALLKALFDSLTAHISDFAVGTETDGAVILRATNVVLTEWGKMPLKELVENFATA